MFLKIIYFMPELSEAIDYIEEERGLQNEKSLRGHKEKVKKKTRIVSCFFQLDHGPTLTLLVSTCKWALDKWAYPSCRVFSSPFI